MNQIKANPDLYKNLLFLKTTDPKAYSLCIQGIMQNVQEKVLKNEEIHMQTPNSYMDYIEFLVREFGNKNQLEVGDLLKDNGYDTAEIPRETEDDVKFEPLQIIQLHTHKTGYERLSFLFGAKHFTLDEPKEKSCGQAPPEYRKVKGLNGKYIVMTGTDLDYALQEMICQNTTYALSNIYMHSRMVSSFRETMRSHKWVLSLEPSVADPSKGLSLIIRKDSLPERCYSYRIFNQFLDAVTLRDSLFEKFGLTRHSQCHFSCEPADISTFRLEEKTIKEINKALFPHRH